MSLSIFLVLKEEPAGEDMGVGFKLQSRFEQARCCTSSLVQQMVSTVAEE